MEKPETISVGNDVYLRQDLVSKKPELKDGLTYCIIRTYSAGVFAGWIDRKEKGQERTIFDSRRLWYWDGAASLSQAANDGFKNTSNCKFAQVVSETDLTNVIEVIPCTEKSKSSIEEVAVWEK